MWFVVLVALVVLGFIVLRAVHFVRYLPKGERLRHFPGVLGATARSNSLGEVDVSTENDWLAPQAQTNGTIKWAAMEVREDLVSHPQQVCTEGNAIELHDLDVDGTALLFKIGAGGDGYEGYLQARDGSGVVFARGGAHGTGELLGGSVDHGRVGWLRKDPVSHQIQVWRWDAASGDRLIHTFDYQVAKGRDYAFAWVLIAGDVTAVTFLPGQHGSVVVHHPDHGVVHLASTSFPTLHRDLVAEARGLRRAAVNVLLPGHPQGVAAQLDLDSWPPTLTSVANEFFPGASLQMGQILGYLRRQRVLRIPNAPQVSLSQGLITDPVGDGQFVAAGYFDPPGQSAHSRESDAVLIDSVAGRRQTLTKHLKARMYLRGDFVAWGQAAPRWPTEGPEPRTGVTGWVAQLVRD
ncbi:hypothetical protein [Demequina sp.]|uniref:hypothetical protein n=1 Tax=Demequina sp. TaxID=2050685 RepID=UPI003D10DFB3